MIVSKIRGGLGNQMFQYACGRAVAEARDSELKLDLSWFETGEDYEHDSFYLENLKIKSSEATEREISSIFPLGRYGRSVAKHIYKYKPRISQKLFNYYHEISHRHYEDYMSSQKPISGHFCRKLLTGSGECYLDGFWHTGDYYHNDVIDIRDELRTELTPSSSLSGENLQVANDIRDSISVSLHIRRGDFVDVSRNISLDYYSRAINELTRVLNDFTLFVFSDEISWAEQNLNVKQPTVYVNNNSIDEGYKDMQLMSICDHNIIANSSFSWWGAWLNTNENKYVIAPSRWTKSWDVRNTDVIPGDWMVLPVNEVGN